MSRVKRQRVNIEGSAKVTAEDATDPSEDHIKKSVSASIPNGEAQEQQSQAQSQGQHRSLFIHSLPIAIDTAALTDLVSEKYPVKHATVVVDPTTKVSRGYGFVTLADPEDALLAKKTFHGHIIGGKRIKVEIAQPRHRRGSDADNHRPLNGQLQNASKSEDHQAKVSSKLIVRNLPWTVKDAARLALLFRSYGKIKQATMPKKGPGLSAGFGFVMMRGRKNAEKALSGVNGKVVDGRTLAVDWAVEKETWESLKPRDLDSVDDEGHNDSKATNNQDDVSALNGAENANGVPIDGLGSSAQSELEDDELQSDHSMTDEEENEPFEDEESTADPSDSNQFTLFIRNVPFDLTDESLHAHFQSFGAVRYARIVVDHETERSKGSGFVCFYNQQDADGCLRGAPKVEQSAAGNSANDRASKPSAKPSLLSDPALDPSGQYTISGRVLSVSAAVSRPEAQRLTVVNSALRTARDKDRDRDKRRMYLLAEGTVQPGSPLYSQLSATDTKMRSDSLNQRRDLLKANPSLHLSLTRLSIRNLPRSITSKHLKSLARQAVVGYATDVREGLRKPISKEEISRGGDQHSGSAKEAEAHRRAKGKGVVKQAKVVFEGREGSKLDESTGAGRSRGYGFVEYVSHRWALMGMRWLNGHLTQPIDSEQDDHLPAAKQAKTNAREGKQTGAGKGKGKRLIVEFAIENVGVVARRRERETRARETAKVRAEKKREKEAQAQAQAQVQAEAGEEAEDNDDGGKQALARRQQIIGRKRMARKKSKGKGKSKS